MCQHRRFLGGGEYLDFPIEGHSIKNDGLNGLITVVAALTYPYKKNRHCFTGAIPRVTRLPVPGVSWGDEAARATDNEIRVQRPTAARARYVVGEGWRGYVSITAFKIA